MNPTAQHLGTELHYGNSLYDHFGAAFVARVDEEVRPLLPPEATAFSVENITVAGKNVKLTVQYWLPGRIEKQPISLTARGYFCLNRVVEPTQIIEVSFDYP